MQQVKIIFKTHLDIGFTNMAEKVKEKYFSTFIRNAVATADCFRNRPGNFRYVWTVGAWLIAEYFYRASAADRTFLEDAIRRGDIVWHAMPFTAHNELMSKELFCRGLAISQELDKRFGKKTIAAKLTDVPGHTRGIIAPLADAGVELLHIGINPASALPDVPPVFRWRDSGGKELLMIYQADYGADIRCGDTLFRVEMTGDNLGPHTPEQVEKILARYPGCDVQSGTLNDLAEAFRPLRDSLPVVSSEIGDTWIHGVGTDPWKVARFKALERLLRSWGDFSEKTDFERRLLEIAEHTWGVDEKTWFLNYNHWNSRDLHTPAARRFAASWKEQRMLLEQAIHFLPDDKQKTARKVLQALSPRRSNFPNGSQKKAIWENDFFKLELNPAKGCAESLLIKKSGVIFRNPGLFTFETFTRQEYARFRKQYLRIPEEPWAFHDFSKPDMPPRPKVLTKGFKSELFLKDNRAIFVSGKNGIFERLEMEYILNEDELEIRLRWFGKDANRFAQAAWMSFVPDFSVKEMKFRKIADWIDPTDVVSRGARTLHAVQEVRIDDVTIIPVDTVLAAPGKRSMLDFHNKLPDISGGVHFNLYNNIWGTNFPMWFGDDMEFRFTLK